MAEEEQQDIDIYFKDKRSMTISEVSVAIKKYVDIMKANDADFQPNMLVGKTLEYANAFATNKNLDTVTKIRR